VAFAEKPDSDGLAEFRDLLLGWFRQYRRDLPWRKDREPYRIWISEIMLQQTRVAAVIPYYERFLARFPNVKSLADAPEDDVLRLWSGLGYYSRARNLQSAARQICAEHGGEFPRTREKLLALPGIGDYTVAAILSIALGEQSAVLDGNVARVIARLEATRGDLREPDQWRQLQATARRLLAPEKAGDWNEAMMELGATLCVPRNPQCLLCPIANFCEARRLGIAGSIPAKRKKRATVAVHLVSAVFLDARGNTLLLPPPAGSDRGRADDHVPSLVAKLWHFPTISAPEGSDQALRELLQGTLKIKNANPVQSRLLEKVRHTVTYRTVSVAAYLVQVGQLPEISGARQTTLEAADRLSISNLTRKILRQALKHVAIAKK